VTENLEDELRLSVMRLARRMRLERDDGDLPDHQLSVLFVLLREGPISIGLLSEHERVTPPSMNRTVNAMAQWGLLNRASASDDGRRVLVDITEAGRRAAGEIRRRRAAWFSLALRELSEAERGSLGEAAVLLQRLADS